MPRITVSDDEPQKLSKRDNLLVLGLLENPPPANIKLRAAAQSLP